MYIDPSAGSLIAQVIAAGIFSLLATMTRVREGVKSFVRGLFWRRTR